MHIKITVLYYTNITFKTYLMPPSSKLNLHSLFTLQGRGGESQTTTEYCCSEKRKIRIISMMCFQQDAWSWPAGKMCWAQRAKIYRKEDKTISFFSQFYLLSVYIYIDVHLSLTFFQHLKFEIWRNISWAYATNIFD